MSWTATGTGPMAALRDRVGVVAICSAEDRLGGIAARPRHRLHPQPGPRAGAHGHVTLPTGVPSGSPDCMPRLPECSTGASTSRSVGDPTSSSS
jgi:hypothetical protein